MSAQTSISFTLVIRQQSVKNTPPYLVNSLDNQKIKVNQDSNYIIPAFADKENNKVTMSVSLKTGGLEMTQN